MKKQSSSTLSTLFTYLALIACVVAGFAIFYGILADPKNFIDGNPEKEPIKEGARHWFGVVYKGGIIVPVLTSLLLIVITFCIERLMVIIKARGRGNSTTFIHNINQMLDKDQIDEAITSCDRQKGSIANVMRAGLEKYKKMASDQSMAKDQKIVAIQKEVEEATSLELPMLEKNLVILATISSVATLMGLFGTVLGMIRAFAALANAGAPDTSALSTGISEALINTALGIGTSALAIIMYNVFTTQIDKLTYGIDESGYSITQTFASKY